MTKISSLKEKISGGNNPLFHELYGTDTVVLKEQAHTNIIRTCIFMKEIMNTG